MIRPLALGATLLATLAATPATAAQRCPPNSHASAVGIPGNLRTAQCFCNRGFVSAGGVCVPVVRGAPPRPHPAGRPGQFVPPQR
jgi:hypothetical protein